MSRYGWIQDTSYDEPGYADSLDSVFEDVAPGIALDENIPVRLLQDRQVTVNGIVYPVSFFALQKPRKHSRSGTENHHQHGGLSRRCEAQRLRSCCMDEQELIMSTAKWWRLWECVQSSGRAYCCRRKQ